MTATARTRLAAVIGSPIRHSLSPVLHNAAFTALGLDWSFVAFNVPLGGATAAVEAVRVLGLEGLSVTMPLKEAVIETLDSLDTDAAALGAVNCICRDGDHLIGRNTDGGGFCDDLRAGGLEPGDLRIGVYGTGGAARAVIRAVAQAGSPEVVVVGRTPERVERATRLAGPVGRRGQPQDLGAVDVVVNATPVGMRDGRLAVDPELLQAGQTVIDLVYEPRSTPLLTAAADKGLAVRDGVGMLVAQAARAFHHWTGLDAPTEVMREAADEALKARENSPPDR